MTLHYTAAPEDSGRKLFSILRYRLHLSAGLIKRLKHQTQFYVNGSPVFTDYRIASGDEISLPLPEEHRELTYSHLCLTEQLFPHLQEVQRTATQRMEQLMTELLRKNPPPNKETDQLGWVRHMNSLKAQAEEIIQAELIYS